MSELAVDVQDVFRDFRIEHGHAGSLKHRVLTTGKGRVEHFRALNGVTLSVPRGSTFALIGANGSGKSTLLKLIAGIFPPSSGTVDVRGRVTALLELGAGFHPELTGRENVYLAGSMCGRTRAEVDTDVEKVKAFSGLDDFFEQPVKVYSSGMFVRLGFAVAVHLDPEVLIVDEVVAVGDEQFQRMCFDHLHELRRRGVTILFVSHSLSLVEQLADHAAWLDEGTLRQVGTAREVIDSYIQEVNRGDRERMAAVDRTPVATGDTTDSPLATDGVEADLAAESPETAPETPEAAEAAEAAVEDVNRWGSGEAQVLDLEFLDGEGRPAQAIDYGEPVTVRLHYLARRELENPNFGLAIWSEQGWPIGAPNTRLSGHPTGTVSGRGFIDFALDRVAFVPGRLALSAAITDESTTHVYDWRERSFELKVLPHSGIGPTGLVDIPGSWSGPKRTP